ncbi:MAG: hypothetical protein ACP5UV_01150, partial [Thermoplasmata archaeon]
GSPITITDADSGTAGFTVTALNLPLMAGQGQTVTVQLNILTPDYNYAGNLNVNLYTSPS